MLKSYIATTVGHVSHGKSTVIRTLSGIRTQTSKAEKNSGCTMNLGFGNCHIYFCSECDTRKFGNTDGLSICEDCMSQLTPICHLSLLDCPGHIVYMSKALRASLLASVVFIIVAADEQFPQPQTANHMKAVQRVPYKIILQNKIDTVSRYTATEQYNDILEYISKFGDSYNNTQIIPISAQLELNMNKVSEWVSSLPEIHYDTTTSPIGSIIRSFNINKSGYDFSGKIVYKGGVIGCVLEHGTISIGDTLELKPGYYSTKMKEWISLKCKVISIKCHDKQVDNATPGDTYGIETSLDPSFAINDNLAKSSKVGNHYIVVTTFSKINECPDNINELIVTVDTSQYKKHIKDSTETKPFILIRSSLISITVKHVKHGTNNTSTLTIEPQFPVCVTYNDRLNIIMYKKNSFDIINCSTTNNKLELSFPNYDGPTFNYAQLLDSALFQVSKIKKSTNKIPIPKPEFKQEFTGVTLKNIDNILESVTSDMSSFSKFLIDETGCKLSNRKDGLFIKTKLKSNKIITIVSKYIKNHCKCSVCEGIGYEKLNNIPIVKCIHCKSERRTI
jgi:translation initiation factor 2 subunit 3